MNPDRLIRSAMQSSLLLVAVVPQGRAECVDRGNVPLVTPAVSWDGPAYSNVAGGSLVGGFLQKLDTSRPSTYACRYYDVRDPLQPTLVDEVNFTVEFGDSEFIAATSGACSRRRSPGWTAGPGWAATTPRIPERSFRSGSSRAPRTRAPGPTR